MFRSRPTIVDKGSGRVLAKRLSLSAAPSTNQTATEFVHAVELVISERFAIERFADKLVGCAANDNAIGGRHILQPRSDMHRHAKDFPPVVIDGPSPSPRRRRRCSPQLAH